MEPLIKQHGIWAVLNYIIRHLESIPVSGTNEKYINDLKQNLEKTLKEYEVRYNG